VNRRASMFFQNVNLNEMVMCLEDLINYFAQPEDDMGKKIHVCRFSAITTETTKNGLSQNTKRSRTSSGHSEIVRICSKRRVY